MNNLTLLYGEVEVPGGKGGPIHKFLSQILLVNIWKCCLSNFRAGGERWSRFQKFEKASFRTVVPTHTKNFSSVAQLKNV